MSWSDAAIERKKDQLRKTLIEILGPEKEDQATELARVIDDLIEVYIWRLEDNIRYRDR